MYLHVSFSLSLHLYAVHAYEVASKQSHALLLFRLMHKYRCCAESILRMQPASATVARSALHVACWTPCCLRLCKTFTNIRQLLRFYAFMQHPDPAQCRCQCVAIVYKVGGREGRRSGREGRAIWQYSIML